MTIRSSNTNRPSTSPKLQNFPSRGGGFQTKLCFPSFRYRYHWSITPSLIQYIIRPSTRKRTSMVISPVSPSPSKSVLLDRWQYTLSCHGLSSELRHCIYEMQGSQSLAFDRLRTFLCWHQWACLQWSSVRGAVLRQKRQGPLPSLFRLT